MLKFKRGRRGEKGYTLVELLVVCAIIGIILAIAIPNLTKARLSANEANARKAMQTIRDAESMFFEQDMDNDGTRNYTDLIGGNDPIACLVGVPASLRCPDPTISTGCLEADALVDNSFCAALSETDGTTVAGAVADCTTAPSNSKAGYCIGWTGDSTDSALATADYQDPLLEADFGWETSMTSALKNGRRDFGVWGDAVIRCNVTTSASGLPGTYEATRDGTDAPIAGACD
ncbi:MAG: prepilin-type N-terminal cleavage/methylation domain-containing protein [Thermodesulfobacteriota bacterium]